MVTVPALGSKSEMVRGMRSPFSVGRRMMNWPAAAWAATSGAERTMRLMPGARVSLRRMGAFMERLLPFGGEIGRAPKSRRKKTERRKVRKDLLSGCRPKRGRSLCNGGWGNGCPMGVTQMGCVCSCARPQALEKAGIFSGGCIYEYKCAQPKARQPQMEVRHA